MPQAPGVHTTESHSYITVMGCLMDYQYIEVMHCATQILVAVSTSVHLRPLSEHIVALRTPAGNRNH